MVRDPFRLCPNDYANTGREDGGDHRGSHRLGGEGGRQRAIRHDMQQLMGLLQFVASVSPTPPPPPPSTHVHESHARESQGGTAQGHGIPLPGFQEGLAILHRPVARVQRRSHPRQRGHRIPERTRIRCVHHRMWRIQRPQVLQRAFPSTGAGGSAHNRPFGIIKHCGGRQDLGEKLGAPESENTLR